VVSIRVKDRYGDNGLVGVAITRDRGETCELDTFLLSCRVIGRGVESALLAYVAEQGLLAGRTRLEGWFLPTKKNAPAREFYSTHGFQAVTETPDGVFWGIDLRAGAPVWPDWIERPAPAGVPA
jgi:FkbH-like protein